MRCIAPIAAAALVLLGVEAVAAAKPAAAAEPAKHPRAPRVLNVPTADLQEAGQLYTSAGVVLSGITEGTGPFFALSFGLGGVAEVDLEVSNRVGVCRGCAVGEPHADPLSLPSALFKMGVDEGRFGSWQPALALGFRAPIGTRELRIGPMSRRVRVARLYFVASKTIGPVRVHAGGDLWDAETESTADGDTAVLHDRPIGAQARPIVALSWRPSIYPRTVLLADLSWAPVFDESSVDLKWLGGWGVRYQALPWGSIELAMRHREGDALSDSTVMVRINGSFATGLLTRD